jgi:hypothetical protein
VATNGKNEEVPAVSKKRGGVAVLVVHGVNAPVPDPDFSTLRDVTNLLVNHDFGPTANYKPASITQFSLKVDGVPKRAPGPAARTEDRGNAVMEDAIGEFKADQREGSQGHPPGNASMEASRRRYS